MYVLTNKQMREADEYTVKTLGVPSLLLMERAGVALADEAERFSPKGKIVCVCGGGNNGGDGFVCARVLKSRGYNVDVVFYAEKQSGDCRVNMEKWQALGGEVLAQIPAECALIVDCLYGTGFKGGLVDKDLVMAERINALKKRGAKILCADIPSGVNGDNGRVETLAVQADKTLCIGEIKMGVLLGDGIDFAGEIRRADIGISLPPNGRYARLTDIEWAKFLLPIRKRHSHKGTYGKAAIVAGSMEYTGAAYLTASACLHAGAGYTALFVPSQLLPYYVLKCPEILLKSTNEGDRYAFNEERMQTLLSYDCIAYGMGMGVSEEVAKGAIWLLSHYEGKLVLDADGLNSLACYHQKELARIFQNKTCDALLTPHAKEFSRLVGIGVKELENEGYSIVKEVAKAWKASVMLKNAVSLIVGDGEIAVNATGCSGQAKGGSGDVLAGVIAALCAQGLSAFQGGVLGAFLVGLAAGFGAQELGEYSLTPSDVIAYLGRAFLLVTENSDTEGGEE